MSKVICDDIYYNRKTENERINEIEKTIRIIQKCKGHCWDNYYKYLSPDNSEHWEKYCRYFAYKDGCICKLDKGKEKCTKLIQYEKQTMTTGFFNKKTKTIRNLIKCQYADFIDVTNEPDAPSVYMESIEDDDQFCYVGTKYEKYTNKF